MITQNDHNMIHRLEHQNKDIILVGTAHVSKESVQLVASVIEEAKPDTVCVELCEQRYQAIKQKHLWKETDIIKVIKEKNDELKKLLEPEKKDVSALKAKLEELNKEVQAASAELYKKAQEEAAKQQQAQSSKSEKKEDKKNEKVVDAEFTEEDKEKKK